MTYWPIALSLMQMECSFQHFSVQYEYEFLNENFLCVKGGYFKKSRLTNCAKMRFLKIGVPQGRGGGTTIKLASCMYL